MRFRSIATLLAITLFAGSAMGQEQRGSIEGVVKDTSGAVLPGVTVSLQSANGAKLEAVTDAEGVYRFPSLAPTTYTVVAALSGFSTQTATNVQVNLGQARRVEFSLPLAGVSETVEVTARTAAVDLTTPATATNISRERIDFIPRGRDFTDVIGQAAGAAPESQAGGISVNGSSGSENRFIIDGIDTTSPQVGTSAVPMRADFMEEVQVKSAGYAAEFGGSTGGVVNAITRSGSNRFSGSVQSEFQQRGWGGKQRSILVDSLTSSTFQYITPPKDDEMRLDPGVSLGGPILRDRLFFFGAYMPGIRDTKRTVNFSNGVTDTFDQDFKVHYGTFNITGNAGSKLLFRGGGNFSPFETTRDLPIQSGRTSLTRPDQYLRGTKGDRNTYSGSVDYIPTSNLTIAARVGRFLTDSQSTGVSFPGTIVQINSQSTPAGLAALPANVPRTSGYSSGVLVTDATARDEYTRDAISVDATYLFTAGGQHQIRGGYQTERIANDAQTGYNADRIINYAGLSHVLTSTGEAVRGTYGITRLLNISTFGKVASRNDALFIQDNWTVRPNLTVNFGLRAEHERVPNFGTTGVTYPIEFGYGEKLAPRLGFTYDPFSDGRTKIYGSWGKYFDVMKYEMPRGSFGGEKWVDYWFAWDNPDVGVNNTSTCRTGSNTINESPVCPGGRLLEVIDQRHNAAEDLDQYVEPNLKPMEEREFQLGLSREVGLGRLNNVVLGARYIRKNLVRTIEDVGVNVPGVGTTYYIANPGEGITLSLNDPSIPAFPKAQRKYDGLELTFDRRFQNNWMLFGSYTLSRLYGNYSGLASSDENGRVAPNVNRFFDHIENTFDRNGNLVYGRLGTDRPHQFKAQFAYQFPSRTTVGLNQRLASGIPISEEANVPPGIPFFPYGRGNLGRTPVLNQTDLTLFQDVRLAGTNFQVGLTVLNLFDRDAATRIDNTRMVGDLPLTLDRFFAGGWDYEGLLAADPTIVDPKFRQADQFQAAREVRLLVKFSF
jgi:hypothetical protein